MLLDFSVDWRWTISGTDVSPHVETWELTREQPDMGTPAWWRGKLVLRPVMGRDLNLDPLTNSLWRQGTSCSLTVAGSLVFTGSILLAYYDDWSTAPSLELEVGDVLAAKNHRQVIPFGEYNALSLLQTLGIPGLAPAGNKLEISTDLTSPVKVLQELTWVTWLKERRVPATLFTRSNGQVSYDSPQVFVSITRTLEQVADFTRQRPALEIPGSVIASASLAYYVQLPQPRNEETSENQRESPTSLITREGDVVKVTYLDSLGRAEREEIYSDGNLVGYASYKYFVYPNKYVIYKDTTIIINEEHRFFESIQEKGERIEGPKTIEQASGSTVYGQVVAQKRITVYWPGWRFFPLRRHDYNYSAICLAYLIEEYSILGRLFPEKIPKLYYAVPERTHLLRIFTRAKGTTQDADSFDEAVSLCPSVNEFIENQQIAFPDWAQPPEPDNPDAPPKLEQVTDVLSEEVKVVGVTGPPVHLTVPWLSVTIEDSPEENRDLQVQIEGLRQSIRYTLRAAASWMATEIAGRAFARRIKMPVPPEWLANPRPWALANIGNEVFWLVGETLRGTAQGVEFEATGILAGSPNTIPPDAFPPGMFPPGTSPPNTPLPNTSPPGLFPPGTIPSFIPLVTVKSTRFPKVGIGCAMSVGEMVAIPGDPWLGMAVEIEYEVSVPVGTSAMVGIGVGDLTEAWLGLAADATYVVEGDEDDEDDSGDEVEGLTLEAEDGEISGGAAVVVYDADASSCYAVEAENSYFVVELSVDSTSLNWARPLRIRVIYKAEDEGEIYVYTIQEEGFPDINYWEVSTTAGYVSMESIIPAEAEPFDGIRVEVNEYPGKIRIDAIQLAPATGDWPPLNPCLE